MNLTVQQKELLLAIVDAQLVGDGGPFTFLESYSFVQNPTGSGLCYPDRRCLPVRADEVDFRQLAAERLIILRVSRPPLSGKATQLGIDTAASLRGEAAPSQGPVGHLPSWKDLQADFLQYAIEHPDLRAEWTWAYTPADQSAKLAPHGQWSLRGGSPGSQHLFKEVARRAALRLPDDPSGAEPWRRWLELMRTEGYASRLPPRQVSWHKFKTAAESGEYLPLPPEFENQQIETIFKSSGDFCHVHSLAERSPMDKAQLRRWRGGWMLEPIRQNRRAFRP